jgi:hypothetical protein
LATAHRVLVFTALAASLAAACSDPDRDRIKHTTVATYDQKSGRLTELTYDRNHNGTIDTWTEMDGRRPLRSRIDLDEDGTIDRWEYYDEKGGLTKVGFSRAHNGKVDAWAYSAPDGSLARVDVSSTQNEHAIDRREFYERGVMVRVEEDGNRDGRVDRWETYENGSLKTAAMDENGDGVADRRLTYEGGVLVLIESEPDRSGRFTRRVEVK